MPRNGSGTYSLPAGNPVVSGTTISSTVQNNTMSDIATAISQSLSQDGQTPVTANIPMGGFKFTGLGAGGAAGESVRYEQFASPPAIGGTAAAAGTFTNLSATGTLSATGATTLSSTANVVGNFSVNTNKMTVAAATGNTAIAGTLGVTGLITATAGLSGNVTGSLTGNVTGNVTGSSGSCTGNAANVTGTVAIANGGTGQTTATAGFNALAGTQSIAANGYMHLGGVILQWGIHNSTTQTDAITYPLAFPTATLGITITSYRGAWTGTVPVGMAIGQSTTGFTLGVTHTSYDYFWWAIGT